jgi:hypothetical protein
METENLLLIGSCHYSSLNALQTSRLQTLEFSVSSSFFILFYFFIFYFYFYFLFLFIFIFYFYFFYEGILSPIGPISSINPISIFVLLFLQY